MPASVFHTITGLNGAEVILPRINGEIDRSSFLPTVLSLLAPGPPAREDRTIAGDLERDGDPAKAARLYAASS
jgi:hypothetical protein